MITESEILIRMNDVVSDILEHHDFELKREMTAKEVSGWDSLAHISIIVGMENEFGVKFKLAEIKIIQNIGDFVDLVKAKTQ